MGRTSCDECVKANEAIDKKPPCDKCLPPLLEFNKPYLTLYGFCSDQYIVGPGGAVGLSFLAVDRAMDYFEINQDERVDFWNKVRTLAAGVLARQHKAAEAARAANQKR